MILETLDSCAGLGASLIPLSVISGSGAAHLTRQGQTIRCGVLTPDGLVACRFVALQHGGVIVERVADGRRSRTPLPYARVLVDQATAARCRRAQAEAARAEVERAEAFATEARRKVRRAAC